MQTVVRVKAPAHFAAFCVAINEPFTYLGGSFFMPRWQDVKSAKAFCADNGVRPCDLAEMTFSTVDVLGTLDVAMLTVRTEYDPADVYAALEGDEAPEYSDLEREALEAYRRELNEYGSVGMSREAFIAAYTNQNR